MNYRHFADLNRRSRAPVLPPRVRGAIRLLVSLPLVAFLVAAGFYCAALGHILRADLAPVAAGEFSRQIHHEILLGSVDFQPDELILHHVVVSSRRTFVGSRGEAGASTSQVAIHYSLHDLLFDSGNAAHAIGDIVIDRPNVLIERFSMKRFNFSDIIDVFTKKPPKPHAKPFAGRIIAHGAVVHLRDYTAPAGLGTPPAYNSVSDVSGTVDFSSTRVVYFVASGHGDGRRIADFSASGDASRQAAGRFRVFAKVSDGDAAYWSSYFKAFPLMVVKAGHASLDLTVARLGSKPPPGLPVDLLGRVVVRDGAIDLTDPRFRHLPVRSVNGTAIFTGSGVTIEGSLLGGGQPVHVDGTVFDLAHPQLAFVGSSPRIDAIRLARFFPQIKIPPGLSVSPAPLTAQVTGTTVTPVVEINADVPAVTFRGNTATNVRTRALFTNNILSFPSTTFRLGATGQGAVRVTVNTAPKNPTLLAGGRVTGVDLAKIHLPVTGAKPPALGGLADVAFLADDRTQPLSVVANVTVDHPLIARTLLRAARGRIVYSETKGLTVSRAVIEDNGGGLATASGTISLSGHSPLNLAVNAAGADLSRLLSPYMPVDVGGLAFVQAHVTGPLAAPVASAKVQVFGGRYGRVATDLVSGTLSGSADAVRLQDVQIRRFPSSMRVSGTVSGLKSPDPSLALDATLTHGYLSDLVSLADQVAPVPRGKASFAASLPPLSGLVTGAARVTGHVKSPQIVAHADATHVTVNAYRIREASADIAYSQGNVQVRNAAAEAEDGASATAHGHYTLSTGRIGAAFQATGLDLDEFDFLTQPYADVDGMLNVQGQVQGTLKSPAGAATVEAKGLTVEGQSFAPFTVSARYANGVLTKTGDPWRFVLETPGATGPEYIVDSLRVSLPTPAHPNAPRDVDLTAQIPESAPENLEHLAAALRGSRWSRSTAGRDLIARLDSLPATLEGTVWVPSVTVTGPFAGPTVRATVGARGLTLGEDRIGTLTAQGDYTGGSNPSAHAEVTTQDVQAAGVPIQSIVAQAAYDKRVITVSRLHAASQEAYLDAYGHADLDGAIDADLDASNVPLSLFNLFLPPSRRLSGQIGELTVVASGQTQAPDLTASVNLDHPALIVTTPPETGQQAVETEYGLDSIRSGKLTLFSAKPGGIGKVLAANDLSAFKGGRRVATLSGTLPVSFGGSDAAAGGLLSVVPTDQPLHAVLQIADLGVLTVFSPSLIDPKKTTGALKATVDYGGPGGTGKAARLLGQVDITNASIGLTGFDTSLKDINGHLLVQDDRISVQSLTAASTVPKGGTLSVTGGGILGLSNTAAGHADLHLTAKNLAVDETGRGNFLAKTYNSGLRARVNGDVTVTGPWLSPLIATRKGAPVVISDAVGTLPTAPSEAAPVKAAPLFDPHFDVTARLGAPGKTVAVRSSFLQADANGDMELGGSLSNPTAKAHVNVAKGQFFLPPSTRLAIVRPDDGTSNTVDVRYPVPSPDPADNGTPTLETRVHLVAQAKNVAVSQAVLNANSSVVGNVIGQTAPEPGRTSLSSIFGPAAQRYTITVSINGLLNSPDPTQPRLDLTSDPGGLTKQQMLASLVPEGALQGILGGGQGAETALKQQLAEAFGAAVIPTLLSPLEEGVAGALGLEDFSVAYAPDAPVNVTLSKQIAPRLLVTYIRAIGARTPGPVSSVLAPPEYTLKLGYGITNHFQVSLSTDDQRNNTVALESIFNF